MEGLLHAALLLAAPLAPLAPDGYLAHVKFVSRYLVLRHAE